MSEKSAIKPEILAEIKQIQEEMEKLKILAEIKQIQEEIDELKDVKQSIKLKTEGSGPDKEKKADSKKKATKSK